jgi:hypothetical protein
MRFSAPLIVAGHAYAGAVIATGGDDRVKALVYIAALAPDEGCWLPACASHFWRTSRQRAARRRSM